MIGALSILALVAGPTSEQVFTDIYDRNIWSDGSGGGSLIQNAKEYVSFLQAFLKDKKIRTVVDLGCGDWQFSRHVNWKGVDYIGYDVVKSVIEANRRAFSREGIVFIQADGIDADLPEADLLLCKDVLQHLPNEDVVSLMKQLHKFKHCLITNDVNPATLTSENPDVVKGETRPIDLSQPPFSLKGKKILTYSAAGVVKQVFWLSSTSD
jgi:SAM-dependent methyltransferase